MLMGWWSLAGLIVFSAVIVGSAVPSGDVFTSSFLVRFKRNVESSYAHEIANKYGYDNLGPVRKQDTRVSHCSGICDGAGRWGG